MIVAYTRVYRHPLGQTCDGSTCHETQWNLHTYTQAVTRCVCFENGCSEWERQKHSICSGAPPPQRLLLAKGSSLTACVVRGLAYTTHLFPMPAWQVLATGRPVKTLLGEVVGVSWDNLGHRFRGLCISSFNGGSRTTIRTLSQRTGKDSCLQPCYWNWCIAQNDWNWYQHFIK